MVGRLGGYNAMNLQVHLASDHDLSYMPYRQESAEHETTTAFYHDLGNLEVKDKWVRFRCELTALPVWALLLSSSRLLLIN